MTEEETKQLKEKFRKKFYDGERFFGGEELWQFIQDEIITPYEEQLEQVERKKEIYIEIGPNLSNILQDMYSNDKAMALSEISKSQNTQINKDK